MTATTAAIKGRINHETMPDIRLMMASVLVVCTGGSGVYCWSINNSYELVD
jgi:hypothetical protein